MSPTKKKKRRRSKKEAKMRMQAKQLLKKKKYLSLSLFLHTPLELHHTSFLSFFVNKVYLYRNSSTFFLFFRKQKKFLLQRKDYTIWSFLYYLQIDNSIWSEPGVDWTAFLAYLLILLSATSESSKDGSLTQPIHIKKREIRLPYLLALVSFSPLYLSLCTITTITKLLSNYHVVRTMSSFTCMTTYYYEISKRKKKKKLMLVQ